MKILYFGTPEFTQTILATLADSEFGAEIVGVVTREDKPKNRGHKLTPPPVKVEAEKHGYPVFQPSTLKEETFGETFRSLDPDLCVVAAYGKILPHYVLFEPKYGAINVHGSLLPAYRGAAPIQWAVLDGCEKTGVTIEWQPYWNGTWARHYPLDRHKKISAAKTGRRSLIIRRKNNG